MKDESKVSAYNKMQYLTKNIGYEKLTVDDKLMEDYHSALSYSFDAEYIEILNALSKFNSMKGFENLVVDTGTIRDDYRRKVSAFTV
jgi:hypothetical protein